MGLLLGCAAATFNYAAGVAFIDDAGTTHEIASDATIVTGAMDAVALSHFGLPSDRILATFGERSSSGSNYGGFYSDGNLVYGDTLPHNTTYDPNVFPADPDVEERAYLDGIVGDLSAECSASNYYCDIIDITFLNENGWPDLIIVGAFYDSLITKEFIGNATDNDVSIVLLKNSYDGDQSEQEPRDMIEMIEVMESLALALGATEDTVLVGNDKESFCEAAKSFRQSAQAAQDSGVRSMASFMPYQGDNPEGVTGAFLPSPDYDPVLSMMQNLGLPILYNEHSGNYWEYHAGDYSPGAGSFKAIDTTSLSGTVAYNVDFWLYDDRVSLDFLSDQFAEDWPHPALVENQYAYWPSNGRILSYKHAAEILTIVGSSLREAQRVTPATDCTPFDGEPGVPRVIPAGEYSCVSIRPIDFCSAEDLGIAPTGVEATTAPMEPPATTESVDMSSSGPARIATEMPLLLISSVAMLVWNL